MTADAWTRAVRHQLRLGRLLPLGDRRDGAWIAERAAEAVLRGAAEQVRGVRLGALRIALAVPEDAHEPAVPPPPGALPPGPLRITADFAAVATEPLPTAASRLRTALATAAAERLGLVVDEVDLQVTVLLDHMDDVDGMDGMDDADRLDDVDRMDDVDRDLAADIDHVDDIDRLDDVDRVDGGGESLVAAIALAVPGVARLTGALGGLGRAVHIEEVAGEGALPRLHARVELAVRADRRALDVARGVRARVGEALPGHPTVAVLVTEVS
ncbi:nucleopolyhedrovirus P10 family protein [Streptomyces sp. NBC_00986]|uniref:nucleopolyhedrovirus P10 family protein n=1 Tax=Streptomyces sp. NBC_00986 TaxID=2903702 RepID=UPI00386A8027|nr:nucleopolyhedrovirus P10 family protein [Streptomyces sp. NBC_00986]